MRKNMPAAHAGAPASGLRFDLSPRALDRWNPGIQAAASDDNTISIFDVIGQDYWTGEGVTTTSPSPMARRAPAMRLAVTPSPVQ